MTNENGAGEQLVRQLEAELRPVLSPADFEAFDFDRAFARVVEFAEPEAYAEKARAALTRREPACWSRALRSRP